MQNDETVIRSNSEPGIPPKLHPVQRLMALVPTALRLGVANVGRVLVHRTCKPAGIYRWMLPSRKACPISLGIDLSRNAARPPIPCAERSAISEAEELLAGSANYFSVQACDIGNPPNWFLNPIQNKRHPHSALHWSGIADFCAEAGDIKVIWEISRFTWAPVFARAWRISGDARYLSALQFWIQDWWKRNPPNIGPNWMCGQETSIRMINALLALRLAALEQDAGPGLVPFVEAHCRRIDLTTFYAVAQENNHATSEAAGLFVGGTWLVRCSEGDARRHGHRWAKKGRKLLERGVRRLVLPDGSFSQHSLTYHRLMLDTLAIAEAWRRYMGEAPFSKDFYARASAATRWLGAVIDPVSGDGPNLGANDGAQPYRLDASAYRDFRTSLQLASTVFIGDAALGNGPWNESAAWLGIDTEKAPRAWINELSSTVFPDGGYVVLRNKTGVRVLLRAPTARFRPSHADALHLDLWWKGENVLRDGGSYSYSDDTLGRTLSSVVGHNIEQFDDHDQMPRLGRFLYGSWVRVIGLPTITTRDDEQSWVGSYTDFWGARHERTVILRADALSVRDNVQGFKRKAVLRWRLAPGDWSLNGVSCTSAMGRIRVESSVPIRRVSLENGWESRHYLGKSALPVLEVEIGQSPAVLTTTVTLS